MYFDLVARAKFKAQERTAWICLSLKSKGKNGILSKNGIF